MLRRQAYQVQPGEASAPRAATAARRLAGTGYADADDDTGTRHGGKRPTSRLTAAGRQWSTGLPARRARRMARTSALSCRPYRIVPMPFDLIPSAYLTTDFAIAMATIAVAGMVRGFSGFGSALILSPVLSLLWGPTIGVPVAILVEVAPALQLTPPALRVARWHTVWWIALPALLLIPLGAWLLVALPAETMRRGIALLVLTLVAVLWSGWRYRGPRGNAVSATVGALGGFLSGSTGIGGPPAIIYLMSSGDAAALVRANLIGYFTVIGAGLIGYYAWNGLINVDILWRAGLLIPVFVVGIFAGSRLFGLASERTFRHIAFSVLTLFSTWVLLA